MKKLIIMSALVMGGLSVKTADAQIGIRINLHLGGQPVYAPAPAPVIVNEPVYDDYYYLPEVEAYYSVGERCYYYNDGESWISAAYLPGRYHDFDWRSAKRYEVRTARPYLRHDVYRGKFGGYVNRNDYYARAYPNRGREQYDNRGGFNRHDDERNAYNQGRNQGGYNQPDRNQGQGGYNQPNRNQGGYNQPSQNQGGYNQGGNQSNPGRNQGGYSQPTQNQGGQQQPSQGQGQQGGNRGNGQGQGQNQGNGNGQGQPSRNGGQSNGSYSGESHYAANQMGVIKDRVDVGRPVRQ